MFPATALSAWMFPSLRSWAIANFIFSLKGPFDVIDRSLSWSAVDSPRSLISLENVYFPFLDELSGTPLAASGSDP